jgi:hypothetical protein
LINEQLPISKYLQNAFASSICRGVLHSGSNNLGDPTITHTHRAREVATFNRFRLYKNSIPLGASACDDVVIE